MSAGTRAKVHYWVRVPVRLFLAFIFLSYAVAKLVGTQFIDGGPTLDKPVGELSGFEFTWAYFGYSKLFSWFVAGGQLTAAVLLLFDRTARLGAAVLLPITVNIVVVNFGFNISSGTKVVSVVYLLLNLFLVAGDWRAWKKVLWDDPATNTARPRWVRWPGWGVLKLVAFVGLGTVVWYGLDTLQKQFIPVTPLSGDWRVEGYTEDGQAANADPTRPHWRHVFFSGEGLTVGTDRGMLNGRYKLPGGDAIELGYDPVIPPPPDPEKVKAMREQVETATTIEEVEAMLQRERERVWPETITGTYRRDGAKLVISGTRGGKAVELVLRPLVRPKF
jgi:uncharacterized membrane protein YphA (DoxX/SURF4 family)